MSKTIKEKLLGLPEVEIKERKQVRADYYFYKGRCTDECKAKSDKALLGQNWDTDDVVDYTPTQEIRNKIKPLLKKQARFMFGKEPTITLKPDDNKEKDKCEELRKFLDDVFETNQFWKNTRKAFLMSTIKKRVLLRVEANKGMPVKIKYENIEEFYYKESNGRLVEVKFFEEDSNNVFVEKDDNKIYYIHRYFYKRVSEESKELTAHYEKLTYKGNDLDKPIESTIIDTGFTTIPCWLIKNAGELNEDFGESDIEDIRDIQNQYNRRVSDYADALRFQMFGSTAIVDGDEGDVNNLTIAPGGLNAIKTNTRALENGKQATIQRQEFNFGSSEAINTYLDRATRDMNLALDMPDVKELVNIPSAKAMKYMYNDLIARCEEKWNDWEPILKELINFIIEVSKYCYCGCFKEEWKSLIYTTTFAHNYPIPSDDEDKKKIALSEVDSDVRSRKSYIREFTNEEDPEQSFNEIIEEKSLIDGASMGEFNIKTKGENLDE